MTILNLDKLENKKLNSKIINLFTKSCEDSKLSIISSIFTKHKKRIGLFLNGRVINFPFCMVSDTYEQLLEDKKFIDNTEDLTPEDKLEWDFTYLLYFIPITTKVIYILEYLINLKNKYVIPEKENIDFAKCSFNRPEDRLWVKKALLTRLITSSGPNQIICALIKYDDFLVNIYAKELKEV